ncbi:prolyl oligopeptidase family serine peptidase [Antrihabitans sp. YC3-6]|uniref:Prolyl oligopeptidase family serine peptidase n=2 Tax=Antrihabitans stalagmiti TaxID=2799499 RepID=A0A934U5S9_9NOCA|nr:prolyl oligopeptidase family serine peptidase [Antrihabitans stalagmiti]
MPPTRLLDCGMDYADVLQLQRLTADVPWDVAAESLGTAQLDRAAAADAAGHSATAIEAYRFAAANFLFAQMAYNFDGPRKVALYGRFTAAVGGAGKRSDPAWQRVEIPFAGGRMFGWLIRPTADPVGTVILLGGQSGWGAAYLAQADALTARGLAVLLAEGPGQGDTRMVGGVYLDVDVAAAYSAFVNVTVDCTPAVGIWGNSLGGLYAAVTAARDPRIVAVCVNGAPAQPKLLGFRAFGEQAAAMLGTTDPDAIQANFDRIALRPGRDRIGGALMVLHGGNDPLIGLVEQQPFLDAATDATLRIWDDGEHTIYNHAAERTALVADWFADHLANRART